MDKNSSDSGLFLDCFYDSYDSGLFGLYFFDLIFYFDNDRDDFVEGRFISF